VQFVVIDAEEVREGPGVSVVLVQGVLESMLLPEQALRPFLLCSSPKIQPFMFLVSTTNRPKRETMT